MAISEELRQHLMDVADENDANPDELIAEVERQMEADAQGSDQSAATTTKPTPGKNDPAAAGATSQESGAKAHGGRGYFAYEYPFLKVNQVLESLFLPAVPDGDMFTSEWLAKHGGSGSGNAGGAPPVQ